ncbi:DUF6090 family protein [Altibacter sp.]|uniref:DUF6090 family protein n=1 Tax=Altibacter sp. TaxID=2024823 RepID=UPI000C92463F|nr:DUF6090 family protein [Altibacter sp.]MAP55213.1 hypothetical protein [Altibacter sp.]
MIKFFRHIRQRLVNENRFSKYLLYAIGEIILVVIGILIALSINNWNEEKNEHRIEKDYMQNLLEDLRDDLDIYKKFQKRNSEIYTLVDSIVPGLKADNRTQRVSELSYWTRMLTIKWMIIHPVERTFEQMKSSGHLRLVKNKDVANGISNYYNSLKDFDGYNEAGMLWAADYVETLGKIFDAEILLKILRERKMQDAGPSDMLTQDPIIINQLLNSLQYFNGALNLGETVSIKRQKSAEDLILLIQKTYNLK